MWGKEILLAVISLSAGLIVSGGLFAFISSLGVVGDIADRTHTGKHILLYEDATILIITDHGYSGGGDTLDMPHETAVPIFLVKPSGNCNDTPGERFIFNEYLGSIAESCVNVYN